MKIRRTVSQSLKALFAHRMRTTVAAASVTAGVAAVVITSAIGAGVEADIRASIERIGANLLVVRPAQVKRLVGRKEVKGQVTTLRLEDLDAIAAVETVAEAVPGIEAPVKVKAGNATVTTKVLGTGLEFLVVRRFQVEAGRFFDADDDRDSRRVAVLGARVAKSLFDGDAIGQPIRIRNIPFDVIGVLAPKGVVAGGDEDNQIVIPIRTALRRVFNVTSLNTVFVSVRDSRVMADAEREINAVLRARHRLDADERSDFEVQNAATFLALQQQTVETLRLLTVGVAGVAVVIGGSGILALMLLSVRERTSEIGLRMAVGAKPRDVLVQFLFEAIVLAFGGWASGIALGAAGAGIVALGTAWKVAIPWESLLVSLAMAGSIGLGFGAFPARRASLIPPIRALQTR
jgi:putative ABC transport system permease protein